MNPPLAFNFAEQHIRTGHGAIHVNRFRTYFTVPWGYQSASYQKNRTVVNVERMDPKTLGRFLLNRFDETFNGNFSGGSGNDAAQVSYHRAPNQRWNNRPTLQFRGNIRGTHLKPDWVAVVGDNGGHGLAAQTLRLVTPRPNDALAKYLEEHKPFIANPASIVPQGQVDAYIEDRIFKHILAGRRSWVIHDVTGKNVGPDAAAVAKTVKTNAHRVLFIESAAVERFCSWETGSPMAEWAVGEAFHQIVIRIWTNHLRNFVKRLERPHYRAGHWHESPVLGSIRYQQQFFAFDANGMQVDKLAANVDLKQTAAAMKNKTWVREILAMHPKLAEQLA